jgi:hypothetical protein
VIIGVPSTLVKASDWFELVSCMVAFLYPFFPLNKHRPILQYSCSRDTTPGYIDLKSSFNDPIKRTQHLKNSTSGSCIQDFRVLKTHVHDHEDTHLKDLIRNPNT